jgi:membrane-associated protease RseP (regulator of RpoE activity)
MSDPFRSRETAATALPEGGGRFPPAGSALPAPPVRPARRWLHLLLFLATVVTTLISGTLLTLDDYDWGTILHVIGNPRLWDLGVPYSACLILILGSHEMGHYLACRRYRIRATLPYFIPGPPILGTFGAVIRIRAPITDRRALFDIGVAGPIAGFVVTLPVLVYGLARSTVTSLPPRPGEIGLPSCLLLELLFPLFFPDLQPGDAVRLHPVFVAAWVGLLATGLNLLPVGQLDGGHLLYALSRRVHRVVSRAGIVILIAAGLVFGGWHLIVFGVVFGILGAGHPPTLDESVPPGRARRLVAVSGLMMFVLCIIVQPPMVFGGAVP